MVSKKNSERGSSFSLALGPIKASKPMDRVFLDITHSNPKRGPKSYGDTRKVMETPDHSSNGILDHQPLLHLLPATLGRLHPFKRRPFNFFTYPFTSQAPNRKFSMKPLTSHFNSLKIYIIIPNGYTSSCYETSHLEPPPVTIISILLYPFHRLSPLQWIL